MAARTSEWDTETVTLDFNADLTPPGELVARPRYPNLVRDLETPKSKPLFERFREMLPDDPQALPMIRPTPIHPRTPKPRSIPTMIVRPKKRARIAHRTIVEKERNTEITEVETPVVERRASSFLGRCADFAGFAVIALAIGPTQKNTVLDALATELYWLAYEQLIMWV